MAYVISDDCIACGTCIDECPVEAISEGDKYSINPDLCTECGTCAEACPSEAIHLGSAVQFCSLKLITIVSVDGNGRFFVYLKFVLIGSSYVCFMNKKNRHHRKKRMPVLFIEKEYFILIGLMLL